MALTECDDGNRAEEEFIKIGMEKTVLMPKSPKGRSAKKAGKEIGSDLNDDLEDHNVRGRTFWLRYINRKGEESERAVRFLTLKSYDKGFAIGGFCFLNSFYRDFYVHRIQDMYWMDTGEVVGDPVSFFGRFFDRNEDTILVKSHWHELMLMSHVARCDGEFHPEEAEIMTDFLEWQSSANLSSERMSERRSMLLDHVRSLYPSSDDIAKALKKIFWLPKPRKRELGRYLRMICDADGVLHEAETIWAMKIAEALASSMRR